MTKIELAYKELKHIALADIHPLQGTLKTLLTEDFKKLRAEILNTKFAFAPHVWLDPADNKYKIIDGHQRLAILKHLVDKEHYECPNIPCVVVEAGTYAEAKARVLQATSQYGRITTDGLYEYMNDTNALLGMPELEERFRLPDIDIDKFKVEFYDFIPNLPDDKDDLSGSGTLILRIEFDNDDDRQAMFLELRNRGFRVKV